MEFNSESGESSRAIYLSICIELQRVMERRELYSHTGDEEHTHADTLTYSYAVFMPHLDLSKMRD